MKALDSAPPSPSSSLSPTLADSLPFFVGDADDPFPRRGLGSYLSGYLSTIVYSCWKSLNSFTLLLLCGLGFELRFSRFRFSFRFPYRFRLRLS